MQGLAFTQHYANSKVAKAWIDKRRDKETSNEPNPTKLQGPRFPCKL